MSPEEREELLTAYALGTLSEPDAAVVRDLVRSDSRAAAELSAYHEIVDLIALSAPLRHADPALRARVVAAARRERRGGRRWMDLRRLLPWSAAAAAIVLAVAWGVGLQQDVQSLRRDNSALTAVVEAEAKRLEALTSTGGDLSSEALRLQVESATNEVQLALAVTTSPDVRSSRLTPTEAGHRAGGQLMWSEEIGAGWLTVHDLPPLGFTQVYQAWLDDGDRTVSGGTFQADELGLAEVVVQPETQIRPVRIRITAAPIGGSATPDSLVVLEALLGR